MKRKMLYKLALLLLVACLFIALEVCYGPISQPLSYHNFADQRTFFKISNFFNVTSNFIFLIVGLYALFRLLFSSKHPIVFVDQREKLFYLIFFIGIFLTAFGSGYYHWSPNNQTLVWDRYPMTLAFMSFLAAIVAENINRKLGFILLPILVLFGLFSVFYWQYTLQLGEDDLRLYVFVQFYSILAIPLILILFKSNYSSTYWIWIALCLYIIAKVFEVYDAAVFQWTGNLINGHSLKHLSAGLGSLCICLYLVFRKKVSANNRA